MRIFLKITFIFLPLIFNAQQPDTDNLKRLFNSSDQDSIRYKAAILLYDNYEELNRDSAVFFAEQSVLIGRKNDKKLNEAYSLNRLAYQEAYLGRYRESLNHLLQAFAICENKANDGMFWEIPPINTESRKRMYVLSTTHHIFGLLMRQTGNTEQELYHIKEAKRIAEEIKNPSRTLLGNLNMGTIYKNMGKLDSAFIFETEAERIANSSGRKKYLTTCLCIKGLILTLKGDSTAALPYFYQSIKVGKEQNNIDGVVQSYGALAKYYVNRKNQDSGFYYATLNYESINKMGMIFNLDYHIGTAYEIMFRVYQLKNNIDSAYKYLYLAFHATDSINKARIKNLAEFQGLTLSEQQRLQNAEKEKLNYRNKVRTNILMAGIAILLLIAFLIYRNNLQKQKAKRKIEEAYDNLKATQQQLIHSEKMASLGELTAGIAHEIQNPLNFINNFSEVNKELIDEWIQQLPAQTGDDLMDLAHDIRQNEDKIHRHGKRADAIVKGMLQHSRSSNGQKELTDLNTLIEEYIRLAFHGWRAKDKSPAGQAGFHASFTMDLDPSISKVAMVPQDMGRVLLNLLNNAFYAVTEKSTVSNADYIPTVTVSTKKINGKIIIRVADNGNGIPDKNLEKIFQPFFTTKPTGQGTGLGLSLSYDIIKAHKGELRVESSPGEGSAFIIEIPA
jgi:signal transduction histidine kinase